MMPTTPPPALRSSLLALLRGEAPSADSPPESIRACLRRYECGGYLHRAWTSAGRADRLPPGWSSELAAAFRKTSLDTLVALADFRIVVEHLRRADIPFVVVKGASYLVDLYDDPGCRVLSDVDLLIRQEDAGHAARYLLAEGFRNVTQPEVSGRFTMAPEGSERCEFEFHWSLGLPRHFRLDARAIRERAERVTLEGVECLRPAPEDALVYHVAHLSDHYFGPSLKWLLDLREMLCRWSMDHARLVGRATEWRVRAAFAIALLHLERVFPGTAPISLRSALRPGRVRRLLLDRILGADDLEIAPPESALARLPMRWLTHDRHMDAARTLVHGAWRQVGDRLRAGSRPPRLPKD